MRHYSVNWTGVKHGKLTYIRPTDKRSRPNATKGSKGGIIWEAMCDCGNTTYTLPTKCGSGRNRNCGCVKTEGKIQRKFHPRISTAHELWKGFYSDGCDFESFLLLSQENCTYCGRAPFKTKNRGRRRKKGVSAYQLQNGDFTYNGLDRIDNAKDHSPDNVVPCCWDCNNMRGASTVDEFRIHIRRVYEFWAHTTSV